MLEKKAKRNLLVIHIMPSIINNNIKVPTGWIYKSLQIFAVGLIRQIGVNAQLFYPRFWTNINSIPNVASMVINKSSEKERLYMGKPCFCEQGLGKLFLERTKNRNEHCGRFRWMCHVESPPIPCSDLHQLLINNIERICIQFVF